MIDALLCRPTGRSNAQCGFTLVEVMLALAILGLALTMLMRSAAGSLFATSQAQMLGVVTDLARGKMYDVEERVAKDGFGDGEQTERGTFEAEGFAQIEWEATIEEVELPNFEAMQEVGKEASRDGGKALGAKTGIATKSGSAGSGASEEAAQTATSGFIEQYFDLISQILKVAIRKVTLVVKWKVLGRDRDMKVVAYLTDPSSIDKVLQGLGAESPEGSAGSGSGSGAGSGAGSGSSPTRGGAGGE
jgi:prepilin-type N-terminal cleavage/methylation domain-containing protein